MRTSRIFAATVAVCASLALPAAAAASTITVDRSGPAIFPGPNGVDFLVDTVSFRYEAAPGETNALNAARTTTGWIFTDPGAVIQSSQCMVSPDGHTAFCDRPAVTNRLRELLIVNAGDGGDTVSVGWSAAQLPATFASGAILTGGDGDDRLTGGELADDVNGGADEDRLDGSAGNDQVVGGAGRDALAGGVGDDLLQSRDGEADTADCGPGADRILADAIDAVTSCESDGTTPASPNPAPGAPAVVPVPDRTAPSAVLGLPNRPRRISTILRRGLLVSVRSSEASRVRARLYRGSSRGRTVARKDRTLRASGRVRIRLRLTRSARRELARRRSARMTVRVTVTDRSGNRRTVSRRFTVRR